MTDTDDTPHTGAQRTRDGAASLRPVTGDRGWPPGAADWGDADADPLMCVCARVWDGHGTHDEAHPATRGPHKHKHEFNYIYIHLWAGIWHRAGCIWHLGLVFFT